MIEPVVAVQPLVLQWARESQGLSVSEVALRMKRNPAEIEAWESGDEAPSYPQLEALAYQIYKRPLAVFFLPSPPLETDVKKEFRTLPDVELEQLSADTRYQVRLAHALQLSLKELNGENNPSSKLIFRDIRVDYQKSVVDQAARIRSYLNVALLSQVAWRRDDVALSAWRTAVEEVGIFVFKHSFKQKDVSGFCLIDEEFPVIYLNNSMAKTRQIFSLMHELAHLLMEQNSISKQDTANISALPKSQQRIERFCNALAAEILIPRDDFSHQFEAVSHLPLNEAIASLAARYSVSRNAVLWRFAESNIVSWDRYFDLAREWAAEHEGGKGSGGNYYATQATYLGERYLQLVFSKHYQGKINSEQVADYLGVKAKSVGGLEALALSKAVPE